MWILLFLWPLLILSLFGYEEEKPRRRKKIKVKNNK